MRFVIITKFKSNIGKILMLKWSIEKGIEPGNA